jgi:hypothetical protein
MAPKTRCVNATNSAAYEKRRSVRRVRIALASDVDGPPRNHEDGDEYERGTDCPRDVTDTTRRCAK